MNPRGQGVDDDLVNLGLIAIAAVGVIAAILRLAGSVAAFISGASQPIGGWEAGFRVLSHPGDPAAALDAQGLATWVYWLVLILMVAGVVAAALVLWRRIGTLRHKTTHDPRRLAGVATGRDVRAVASHKALVARGRTLRPSLDKPEPAEIGYQLGRSRGHGGHGRRSRTRSCCSAHRGRARACTSSSMRSSMHPERSSPPQPGPTTSPHPHRPPGPRTGRGLRSPTTRSWPAGRFALVSRAGMRRPLTAMIRATGLASATGLSTGGVESGGFWEGKTRTALQARC